MIIMVVCNILTVAGFMFMLVKRAPQTLVQIESDVTDEFIRSRHPSDQITQTFKRINKAVALHSNMPMGYLAFTALSVLSQPEAVDVEQKAMLDEAAILLEQPALSMQDVTDFRGKYETVFAKPRQHGQKAAGATASP